MERQRIGGIVQLRMCTAPALHGDPRNAEITPVCLQTSWLMVLNENNEVKLWQHKGLPTDMVVEQEQIEVEVEDEEEASVPAGKEDLMDSTPTKAEKSKSSKTIGGVKRKLMKASSFFLKK